jgi:hypothetical protein
MRADEVAALVEREISAFRHNAPEGTIGTPFSAERVASEIALLRESLVDPRLAPVDIGPPDVGRHRKLWLITRSLENGYLVVFDAESERFGLAVIGEQGPPQTVSVWGDLVSTFMAR